MQHITQSQKSRNSMLRGIFLLVERLTLPSIIRILFMVPIYAAVSWLSIVYYTDYVYLSVLGDCYEAFAIASFFTLLCHYVAPDLHEQKNYFRTITPRKWIWPVPWIQKCWGGETGIWRTPRSGLTWFNVSHLPCIHRRRLIFGNPR